MYGERRGAYRVLVGKPKGKRPLGKPRLRWEVNIKMDIQEVRCGAGNGFIWLRIGVGVRGNEPSGFIKCGAFLD
jgi:hypothetical protein